MTQQFKPNAGDLRFKETPNRDGSGETLLDLQVFVESEPRPRDEDSYGEWVNVPIVDQFAPNREIFKDALDLGPQGAAGS